MIQVRSSLVASAVVVLALCIPTSAAAELIGFSGSTNFTGTGHGAAVSATLTNGSSTYTAGWAGELNWLWGADASAATIAPTPDGFAQAFYSYCVDITQFLTDPQAVVVASSTGFYQTPGVSQGASRAAWLFNRYATDIRNELVTDVYDRAAALQVAIWEAMYDNTSSLSGGAFRLATTGDIATYANGYLGQLYSHSAEWSSSSALILVSSTGQDQITNVPEPSTAAMLGLALFVVGSVRRRVRA